MASFKSTLDEALEASLLLYVVDAADPTCEAQLEVTRGVLRMRFTLPTTGSVVSSTYFSSLMAMSPDAIASLV